MPLRVRWALPLLAGIACSCTDPEVLDAGPSRSDAGVALALEVTFAGDGQGRVISETGGLDCNAACTESFAAGTRLTLRAIAAAGSTFRGWSGACAGSEACAIALDSTARVTATFTRDEGFLTVDISGSGSVLIDPPGTSCTSRCVEQPLVGELVRLTATAATGSIFSGWSRSECGAEPSCTVTAAAELEISASFARINYQVAAAIEGSGGGRVVSDPPGIDCAPDCSEEISHGTALVLTALPDATSQLIGWTGACTPNRQDPRRCELVVESDASASAVFDRILHSLTATVGGRGAGLVTGGSGAINCRAQSTIGCSEDFVTGTEVSLAAIAEVGSSFSGWSGACSGTADCFVSMDGDQLVGAAFELQRFPIRVSTSGGGRGTLALSPPGAPCGDACFEYEYGEVVEIHATAAPASSFASWAGDCAGTSSPCGLLIDGPKTVEAIFDPILVGLAVTLGGPGAGTVTSTPAGISCPPACIASFPQTSSVTLSAAPNANSIFWRWRDACGGGLPCTLIMDRDYSVTAEHGNLCDNASLLFNGVNGSVTLPHTPSIETGSEVTVELWYSSPAPRGNDVLISRSDLPGRACVYELSINASGGPSWCIFGACSPSAADRTCVESTMPLPVGRWAHIAATFANGDVPRVFVDGAERGSVVVSGAGASVLSSAAVPLIAGRSVGGTGYLSGSLASVRVLSEALPAGVTFVPMATVDPTPRTVIFWPIEQVTGSTVPDYSELGTHQGIMSGGVTLNRVGPGCRVSPVDGDVESGP